MLSTAVDGIWTYAKNKTFSWLKYQKLSGIHLQNLLIESSYMAFTSHNNRILWLSIMFITIYCVFINDGPVWARQRCRI